MDEEAARLCLTPLECRILGALVEKALTTPEYYPLTRNALLAACNQKNNRAPVMTLEEETLACGILALQDKGLVESFAGAGARALKYRERLVQRLGLSPEERALLCELLLRGPQTPGELRTRAARMHPFQTLEEVQAALQRLAARPEGALVLELPRHPGQKEARFLHGLGDPAEAAAAREAVPAAAESLPAGNSRFAELEARVAALESELAALRSLWQDA